MTFETNENIENELFKTITESIIGNELNEVYTILNIKEGKAKVESKDGMYERDVDINFKDLTNLRNNIVYGFGRWMEEVNNEYTMFTKRIEVKVYSGTGSLYADLTEIIKERKKTSGLSDYSLGSKSLINEMGYGEMKNRGLNTSSGMFSSAPSRLNLDELKSKSEDERIEFIARSVTGMIQIRCDEVYLDITGRYKVVKSIMDGMNKEVKEHTDKIKKDLKTLNTISEDIEVEDSSARDTSIDGDEHFVRDTQKAGNGLKDMIDIISRRT